MRILIINVYFHPGGVDFAAVDESVDPRDGEVSISIFLDDLMEGVESFQLMLIIPDNVTGVQPGNTVTATVSIRDPQSEFPCY